VATSTERVEVWAGEKEAGDFGSQALKPRGQLEVALLTGGIDRHYAFGLAMGLISKGACVEAIGSNAPDGPEMHETPRLNFLNLRGNQSPNTPLLGSKSRVLVYYARLIGYAWDAKPKIFHILWDNKAPDLFLFPCPVARGWKLFLYYRCYGSIDIDSYHLDVRVTTIIGHRGKMNRKRPVLFLVIVFWFPGYIRAQSATGIIATSRTADWSQAGVTGGIPNSTSICATLSPGASASQINSAIASCPSGEVVYLNAGTYNLSSGIDFAGHSNVTLRGAGPDKTFLIFTGSGVGSYPPANISIYGDYVNQSGTQNLTGWTAGYAQGATSITIGSTANLSVGHMIILDQMDDASDTGNVFVCATTSCSSQGSSNIERPGRSQIQISMVTNISGSTVTISPGLYMGNWRSSQSPQAYWPTNQASMDGVEDLSIDGSGSSADANITIGSAVNCWVKNIRSLYGKNWHVVTWDSAHISVVDSYFYGLQAYGTSAYGFEDNLTSASLVENNIFQHIVTPVTSGVSSGDVVAYNYTVDDYYSLASDWMQAGIFPHEEGVQMVLYEGNDANGMQSDDVHGTHIFNTFFRNRFVGFDSADPGRTLNTIPMNIEAFGRYNNVIGNVLGQPGYHSNYEDLATSGSNASKSIYVLGWRGEIGAGGGDPVTISTLMRWGNYDVVTGGVRWDSSEVPNSLSQYANLVPSTQNLPASFFLSSKPSWWGTPWGNPPWPAIGPDVTGGPGPGGHSYDIPAKLCYTNTSKDSNGILNFNADSCYTSSPAPAPPTGLGVVVH
jgi:hypothetical protein